MKMEVCLSIVYRSLDFDLIVAVDYEAPKTNSRDNSRDDGPELGIFSAKLDAREPIPFEDLHFLNDHYGEKIIEKCQSQLEDKSFN